MKIFALCENIIFECDYCNEQMKLGISKTKRSFIIKLNKFHRQHDNNCRFKFERDKKRAEIVYITDRIIEQLKANRA